MSGKEKIGIQLFISKSEAHLLIRDLLWKAEQKLHSQELKTVMEKALEHLGDNELGQASALLREYISELHDRFYEIAQLDLLVRDLSEVDNGNNDDSRNEDGSD